MVVCLMWFLVAKFYRCLKVDGLRLEAGQKRDIPRHGVERGLYSASYD